MTASIPASLLLAAVLSIGFTETASAQGRTVRGEATVQYVYSDKQCAVFILAPKEGKKKQEPEKFNVPVFEGAVRRELPTGRKTKASFADLQAGQRVQVRLELSPGFSLSGGATEVIILQPKSK